MRQAHITTFTTLLLVSICALSSADAQSPPGESEREQLLERNRELAKENKRLRMQNRKLKQIVELYHKPDDRVRKKYAKRGAASAVRDGFGKVQWAMSMDDVIKLYPAATTEPGISNLLILESYAIDTLGGGLAFEFQEGGLVSVSWIGTDAHDGVDAMVEDYNTLRDLLGSKYGAPEETHIWLHERHVTGIEGYRAALSQGHLTLRSRWSSSDTRLDLELGFLNGQPTLSLNYIAAKYAKRLDASNAPSPNKTDPLKDL